MYGLLKGLRIVEGAAFIAGPSCGLYFAQMGAEVVRFDAIGGGPDSKRWPLAANGASLYWEGLNKGARRDGNWRNNWRPPATGCSSRIIRWKDFCLTPSWRQNGPT
jgi:hypothetical protein